VLVVFLPVLLYGAAFFTNLGDIRANLRAITLASVGLVLATMVAVAVVAHELVGIPWSAAFALGAVVSPTDPLAAGLITRRLDVPRRLVSAAEGEGLFNDATALVAYRVAVGAVVAGTFSLGQATLALIADAAGGIAIGLAVGWVIDIRERTPRSAAERHDLAGQRLRGVHPRGRSRRLGRARGRHDRHLHGNLRTEHHRSAHTPAGVSSPGTCPLYHQLYAVRARRPATTHDRPEPLGVLDDDAGRLGARDLRRRRDHPDRLVPHRPLTDPSA
jgi:Sodium/hydrogen exchanger family